MVCGETRRLFSWQLRDKMAPPGHGGGGPAALRAAVHARAADHAARLRIWGGGSRRPVIGLVKFFLEIAAKDGIKR